MKQKFAKKILKKQNSYKVSKKFMAWVEEFTKEHHNALRELAKL